MGKLAELVGAKALKGSIQITCMKTGMSRTCENEVIALGVIGSASVQHRRGAFFYGGGDTPAAPALAAPAHAKKKVKKRTRSED